MSKPKEVHSWKLFTRPNLGAKAAMKTNVDITYVATFRQRKFIKDWVETHGKQEHIYLTEHWINNRRVCGRHVEMMCTICNWKEETGKSWVDKWSWNPVKKWHRSEYIHSSEKI